LSKAALHRLQRLAPVFLLAGFASAAGPLAGSAPAAATSLV